MSGGSYNYTYSKIEDFADELRLTSPLRKVFQSHLLKVAKAMHDIEWVDSCDMGSGDDEKAIREAIGENCDKLLIVEVMKEAESINKQLTETINKIKGGKS